MVFQKVREDLTLRMADRCLLKADVRRSRISLGFVSRLGCRIRLMRRPPIKIRVRLEKPKKI